MHKCAARQCSFAEPEKLARPEKNNIPREGGNSVSNHLLGEPYYWNTFINAQAALSRHHDHAGSSPIVKTRGSAEIINISRGAKTPVNSRPLDPPEI